MGVNSGDGRNPDFQHTSPIDDISALRGSAKSGEGGLYGSSRIYARAGRVKVPTRTGTNYALDPRDLSNKRISHDPDLGSNNYAIHVRPGEKIRVRKMD